MIRSATKRDIPALVEMGRMMHGESPTFRHIPLNLAKVTRQFAHAVKADTHCVIVAADDEPYGVLLGYSQDYWFSDAMMANDLILYVKPERRGGRDGVRLIRAFEKWAKDKGITDVNVGISSGLKTKSFLRLMDRLGYRVFAINTQKTIGL